MSNTKELELSDFKEEANKYYEKLTSRTPQKGIGSHEHIYFNYGIEWAFNRLFAAATPQHCDAMGHYGGHPIREGICPKCGEQWDTATPATGQGMKDSDYLKHLGFTRQSPQPDKEPESQREEVDWAIPKDGVIDVPDELMPLFNSIGMQFKFVTISGKSEVLGIARIIQNAQKFFSRNPHLLAPPSAKSDKEIEELAKEIWCRKYAEWANERYKPETPFTPDIFTMADFAIAAMLEIYKAKP